MEHAPVPDLLLSKENSPLYFLGETQASLYTSESLIYTSVYAYLHTSVNMYAYLHTSVNMYAYLHAES